jgi:protein-L-isoaspartate(D-aspartate) O-methyltransferase
MVLAAKVLPVAWLCVFTAFGCQSRSTPPGPGNTAANGSAETGPAAAAAGASIGDEGPFSERSNERNRLVQELEADGIRDERVLAALRRVPRHAFVPAAVRERAYENRPLPIGHGQTISQPYIVAAMTAAASPSAKDKCLEIGTGSGYQAAVLAEVCESVYSIEYVPELARFGAENLRAVGYAADRVHLRTGDGYRGWPEAAPFDVILVTAAPERVPQPLLEQLAERGRLIIPVGPERSVQELERWVRLSQGSDPSALKREVLMGVRFVPFVGEARQK